MNKHTEILAGAAALATIASALYFIFRDHNKKAQQQQADQQDQADTGYNSTAYSELAALAPLIGSVPQGAASSSTVPAGVSVPQITIPTVASNSSGTGLTIPSLPSTTATQQPSQTVSNPTNTSTYQDIVSDFQTLFGRNPAASGLAFWSAAAANYTPAQLEQQIAMSASTADKQYLLSNNPQLASQLGVTSASSSPTPTPTPTPSGGTSTVTGITGVGSLASKIIG